MSYSFLVFYIVVWFNSPNTLLCHLEYDKIAIIVFVTVKYTECNKLVSCVQQLLIGLHISIMARRGLWFTMLGARSLTYHINPLSEYHDELTYHSLSQKSCVEPEIKKRVLNSQRKSESNAHYNHTNDILL